jgi:hypothetical protein
VGLCPKCGYDIRANPTDAQNADMSRKPSAYRQAECRSQIANQKSQIPLGAVSKMRLRHARQSHPMLGARLLMRRE